MNYLDRFVSKVALDLQAASGTPCCNHIGRRFIDGLNLVFRYPLRQIRMLELKSTCSSATDVSPRHFDEFHVRDEL